MKGLKRSAVLGMAGVIAISNTAVYAEASTETEVIEETPSSTETEPEVNPPEPEVTKTFSDFGCTVKGYSNNFYNIGDRVWYNKNSNCTMLLLCTKLSDSITDYGVKANGHYFSVSDNGILDLSKLDGVDLSTAVVYIKYKTNLGNIKECTELLSNISNIPQKLKSGIIVGVSADYLIPYADNTGLYSVTARGKYEISGNTMLYTKAAKNTGIQLKQLVPSNGGSISTQVKREDGTISPNGFLEFQNLTDFNGQSFQFTSDGVDIPFNTLFKSYYSVNTIKVKDATYNDIILNSAKLSGTYAIGGDTLYKKSSETLYITGMCTTTYPEEAISSAWLTYKIGTKTYRIDAELLGYKYSFKLPDTLNISSSSNVQLHFKLTDEQTVNSEASTFSSVFGLEDLGVSAIANDDTEPKITIASDTTSKKSGIITGDGKITYRVTKSTKLVPKVKITSRGKAVAFTQDGNNYIVDTTQFESGREYTILVKATDALGNSKEYTSTYKFLKEPPKADGSSHSETISSGGKTYSKTPLDCKIGGYSAEDISSIKVYRNGNEVCDATENGSFTISTSGYYTVTIVDIVGNSKTYKLSDLFPDLTATVIIDTKVPTVSVKLNNSDVDTSTWYTNEGKLYVAFKDNDELKSAEVSINGYKESLSLSDKEDTYEVDLKGLEQPSDGIFNVTISCCDMAGHTSEIYSTSIKADFTPPELGSLSFRGNFIEDNGSIYLDSPLNLSGDAYDYGSGIKDVEILRGKKPVEGTSISSDGDYSVKVTNNAGVSITTPLKDFLGTSTSKVIFDNSAPELERVSGFTPDLVKGTTNWYSSRPTFEVKVSDDHLKNVTVYINGNPVDCKSSKGVYTIVTPSEGTEFDILVVATDYMNHTTNDTFFYKVDTESPKWVSASIDSSFEERGGIAFFKTEPKLTLGASDSGVGGIEYSVIKDGKAVSSKSGMFALSSGVYSVEVKDALGNTTSSKLSDLVEGLSVDTLIVDTEKPKIKASLPKGDVNGWYADDLKFSAKLSDDVGIRSARVYVNDKLTETLVSDNINVKSTNITVDTSKAKADDNGMYAIRVECEDNAGNVVEWSDKLFIDRTPPRVDKFEFTGEGYSEGSVINGRNRYGFYFRGSAYVDIYISDGEISSGLASAYITLTDATGDVKTFEKKISNGKVRVELPENFKGFISAYAEDLVGNKGNINKPDGVITETRNFSINNTEVSINLPNTPYKDKAGINLYPNDIIATAKVKCTWSGVRELTWGIGSETKGTVTVDNSGTPTGDVGDVLVKDRNLVVNLSKTLSLQGNTNGSEVWVEVKDRTGYVSKTSEKYSIDKDVPIISVSYDSTVEYGYYNKNRVARITVKEANFDPSKFTVGGTSGTLGTWSSSGDGTWSNTITFSTDGEYKFTLDCTDRAGNKAKTYSSETFYIDKTNPVLKVTWDNENNKNGNYYSSSRTAHISVTDKYFDGSLFHLTGDGSISGWGTNGDVHTASVSFPKDGEYEFTISGKDKAGNESNSYSSGKFIVDQSTPKLEILGVQEGVSYKDKCSLSVKLSDEHLDTSASSVTLQGMKNNIKLKGGFNGSSGVFTFDDFPKLKAYDDVYTLTANVVDKAGNKETKTVVFSVNRFGSAYEFLDNTMLGSYICNPKDIEILEYNVDKLDTSKAKVVVLKDGHEIDVPDNCITIKESRESNRYSYTYKVNKKAFTEDGKYLIQIYSHANEGSNYSSVSEEYGFVLDTHKPEIIISGIKSDSRYANYKRKVSIDVRDLSGVRDIRVELNGNKVSPEVNNGVYSFTVGESTSSQNLKVYVTDLAGNEAEGMVSDFLVTSNRWVILVNTPWFKWLTRGISAFVVALVGVLLYRRRRSISKEARMLEQQVELYQTSTQGSTSQNQDTSEKSEPEDLE